MTIMTITMIMKTTTTTMMIMMSVMVMTVKSHLLIANRMWTFFLSNMNNMN